MAVPEKTDHFAQISHTEILVLRCCALFTLRNGEVRIAVAFSSKARPGTGTRVFARSDRFQVRSHMILQATIIN